MFLLCFFCVSKDIVRALLERWSGWRIQP